MKPNRHPLRPEAPTDESASSSTPAADEGPPKRLGWIEGHLPEIVDPLRPGDPETSFTETKHMRRDGWTPERQRIFLENFAEGGVIVDACEAAGMSARSVYNLRNRDPLFAAGLRAATLLARPRLADEVHSRAVNGVVERIYKDGIVVAERHRYDNRLTMAALTRLDARADRAEERGDPHLRLVARWDDYLAALGEGRTEDGMALLAPPETGQGKDAPHRELRELPLGEDEDCHKVWVDEDRWWTDYPPPAGFAGEERGAYGDYQYRRALSPDEQAAVDAEEEAEFAAYRARAEAQRDACFFGGAPPSFSDPPGPGPFTLPDGRMMMLKDHDSSAILAVSDLGRARAFYGDLLGLELDDQDAAEEGVLVYRTGATRLVVYRSDHAGTNRANAVVWGVGGDLPAIVAELEAKGARFEHYPDIGRLEGNVHVAGNAKLVWLKDPDGNILHIHSM